MNAITLTLELQIMLVAGYAAWAVTSVGRHVNQRAEEIILRSLAFGLVARASFEAIMLLPFLPTTFSAVEPVGLYLLVQGLPTIIIAIAFGAAWRRFGRSWFAAIMRHSKVYRDDHENTVLTSIGQAKTRWQVIQVHLKDGRVLEADYGRFDPTQRPLGGVTVNNDGIAIYVTASYAADGTKTEYSPESGPKGGSITYVPVSEIAQMDIDWQPE